MTRLSLAKAGLESLEDVIPGLRSLRALTRGYYLPPLRGSLTPSLLLEYLETSLGYGTTACRARGCFSAGEGARAPSITRSLRLAVLTS